VWPLTDTGGRYVTTIKLKTIEKELIKLKVVVAEGFYCGSRHAARLDDRSHQMQMLQIRLRIDKHLIAIPI
jgi:hypothetical protein